MQQLSKIYSAVLPLKETLLLYSPSEVNSSIDTPINRQLISRRTKFREITSKNNRNKCNSIRSQKFSRNKFNTHHTDLCQGAAKIRNIFYREYLHGSSLAAIDTYFWFNLGDDVIVNGKKCVVRYIGELQKELTNPPNFLVGVEFELPVGSCNGTYEVFFKATGSFNGAQNLLLQ